MAERSAPELSRRWKRNLRRGLLASVGLHLLLLLIFRGDPLPPSPFAAAGPRAWDDRAAAGGGMEVLALRPPPPELPEVPLPLPSPDSPLEIEDEPEPEPEIEPPDVLPQPELALFEGTRGDPGLREGPGLEQGTGAGDAGTADEGRFRVVPPTPRGLILPPADRPRRVRGMEVAVWVFVDEAGRVVPDSTRIDPRTGDSRFDRRLRQQAAEWRFQPARRGGHTVPEWYRYLVTL